MSYLSGDKIMLKILAAFIVFSAVALGVVFTMGDSADLAGEAGHGSGAAHAPAETAAPAAAPAEPK